MHSIKIMIFFFFTFEIHNFLETKIIFLIRLDIQELIETITPIILGCITNNRSRERPLNRNYKYNKQ